METASLRPDSDRPDDDARPATAPAPSVSAPEGVESAEPTLSELLTGTAHGDQASFSVFYQATAEVVFGMALLMHEDLDGAHTSTAAVYHHLWHQADERARDLRLQTQTSLTLTEEHAAAAGSPEASHTYRPSEYELVLEWLIPLAHRIMVERFREGEAAPIRLTTVDGGGGVAGLPEEVIDDLPTLSDAQTQALALSYLAGGTHQQIAQTVGAAIPAVKSRLRDGMTRLHGQRNSREEEIDPILRAAVTREVAQRTGTVKRNFTDELAADLEKGLLVELAEIYALDAIDDRERALLDESVLTADEATAQQWDTRVLAARRTLAEIFTAHPALPPGHLLDDVLDDLHDQEIGMGMVEGVSTRTEEAPRREPLMKRWMILAALGAALVAAIVLIWQFTGDQDVVSAADADPQARVLEDIELAEGGTARAVVSEAEDLGYVDFEDVGSLDGLSYQAWLIPSGEQVPSSLGSFTSDELEDETFTVEGLDGYDQLLVTAEEIRGNERPTGEMVVEIPLREPATDGPQYGGVPGQDQADEDDAGAAASEAPEN